MTYVTVVLNDKDAELLAEYLDLEGYEDRVVDALLDAFPLEGETLPLAFPKDWINQYTIPSGGTILEYMERATNMVDYWWGIPKVGFTCYIGDAASWKAENQDGYNLKAEDVMFFYQHSTGRLAVTPGEI